jgi:hypothetical protein
MVIETPEESEARRFFESLGYVVTRVPESNRSQQADYSIENGVDQFIAEVKSRGRDEDFERRMERFGRAESQQTIGRSNPISKQISVAAGQLAATAAENPSLLRIIVFVAAGDDPELQVDQFQATLYGKVDLLREGDAGVVAVPCFYFTFSDFFRLRGIDAAVVLAPAGARLCINSFAGRRDRLGESKLHKEMSAVGAVTDPEAQERLGGAFLADTDIDRRDEAAILSYVRSKYGRPELLTFLPTKFRAAVKVPHPS